MGETPRTQDDQVMAALAHAAAILPFWGAVAAIVIWATQKDKSEFIRSQALQALIYQVLPILVGLVFFICYFCSFGGTFLIIPLTVLAQEGGGSEGIEMAIVVLTTLLSVGLPFLAIGIGMLLWLVYLGYAIYAAVRVFQGNDFRYVIVGRWLDKYMTQETAV
jgi:uncharacterized Tic20 family protein